MSNTEKTPNPIDVFVGSRIRFRRNVLGLSQEKLGERLGITFQQIQKYEKGLNRVGASRLQAISEILEVPVSFFFEDSANMQGFSEGKEEYMHFCSSTEGMQLMRSFMRISDAKVRRKIIDLTKTLSTSMDPETVEVEIEEKKMIANNKG